jgi:hypothetical protein
MRIPDVVSVEVKMHAVCASAEIISKSIYIKVAMLTIM